jgi:UDP-N-acetylglucosamine 1-carboxyvinyltransferase
MEAFKVEKSGPLKGDVFVPGAKNSVLKLMAASLMAQGTTTLTNVPNILDVEIMAELLRRLGCQVIHDSHSSTLEIVVPEKIGHKADYDLVRKMRASISVLGPLVARCFEADIALPGGDAIGSRGLDIHLQGLEKLGCVVHSEHGYLIVRAENGLSGTNIALDFPSVGATENVVMAATLAKGTSTIENVAREPEIVDLCQMLVKMGAKIEGIGSSVLEITGVEKLNPTKHDVVPDRIVAGTWAIAAVMTQGDITIHGVRPSDMELVLEKLRDCGAEIKSVEDRLHVTMRQRPSSVDIVTLPYPGFPTDLQPQMIALNSIANGSSMVTENLFEARFRFVNELARLGADVKINGHHCLVRGIEYLSGAPVEGTDVRAGASLVLAGLVADGTTYVHEVHHIDRGYAKFVENLQNLGAKVSRVEM